MNFEDGTDIFNSTGADALDLDNGVPRTNVSAFSVDGIFVDLTPTFAPQGISYLFGLGRGAKDEAKLLEQQIAQNNATIRRYEDAVCEAQSTAYKLAHEAETIRAQTEGTLPGVDYELIDRMAELKEDAELNQRLADEYQRERSEFTNKQKALAKKGR